ncbi:DUF2249 domain-containing protein [Natrialbaceae archaeon A-arb3/5]
MATESIDRTLDVREIDGPPFDEIIAELDQLTADERLRLIAPFEPKPLYEVLDARGFDHESQQQSADLWYVHIEHA